MRLIRRAFTLVELLVVIAIIGILAAIIAPNAFKAVEKAKIERIVQDIRTIKAAGYLYYADTGDWPKAGQDWYDPGAADHYGFDPFLKDDGSDGWDGPYLEEYPSSHPFGGRYRYWKSYITGVVRGPGGKTISVNNTKCAVITINGFRTAEERDKVDEKNTKRAWFI